MGSNHVSVNNTTAGFLSWTYKMNESNLANNDAILVYIIESSVILLKGTPIALARGFLGNCYAENISDLSLSEAALYTGQHV